MLYFLYFNAFLVSFDQNNALVQKSRHRTGRISGHEHKLNRQRQTDHLAKLDMAGRSVHRGRVYEGAPHARRNQAEHCRFVFGFLCDLGIETDPGQGGPQPVIIDWCGATRKADDRKAIDVLQRKWSFVSEIQFSGGGENDVVRTQRANHEFLRVKIVLTIDKTGVQPAIEDSLDLIDRTHGDHVQPDFWVGA